MPTPDEERNERARLVELLDELAAIDPDELVRTDELGSALDFRDGVSFFERTLDLFKELRALSLDLAPYSILKGLADQAADAKNKFDQILSFDTDQQNPGAARTQLIEQIRDSYDRYYTVLAPTIAFSTRKGTDFSSLERQARRAVDEIDEQRQAMADDHAASKEEAESILDAMRTAALESGVAQTSIAFEKEAERQKKDSDEWLTRTVALAIATGLFAVLALAYWLFLAPDDLPTSEAIQIGLAKLLVFSVLYYALVWSGRNFLAHRHNQTVNAHRQNALRTFEAFVSASTDETTKNAVLLQATQSIFAPQATGYLAKDGGSEHHAPQIIEIVRSIANPSS